MIRELHGTQYIPYYIPMAKRQNTLVFISKYPSPILHHYYIQNTYLWQSAKQISIFIIQPQQPILLLLATWMSSHKEGDPLRRRRRRRRDLGNKQPKEKKESPPCVKVSQWANSQLKPKVLLFLSPSVLFLMLLCVSSSLGI